MAESRRDIWAEWLLHRRFRGDREQMQTALVNFLYPVRDKVLKNANLSDGKVLLDVGCGDGLIAFGALEKFNMQKVIFSDISRDLLNHSESIAREMQVLDRCEFLFAPADDLSAVSDNSMDAVTTRSVLIYVSAKQKAFNEFFRVLKPDGRLSIFEPINRFSHPEPPHLFGGYDISPVLKIADKIKAVFERLQPIDTDPMLDFDEQDLIAFAEKAGFREIHLDLQIEVKLPMDYDGPVGGNRWEKFLKYAGNPKIPTLEEAMDQVLSTVEIEKFTDYLRPLVNAKLGSTRSSLAYLWAVKG
jgi:ubiquinone/menaquinone biosynthesis C-methylase UbiE